MTSGMELAFGAGDEALGLRSCGSPRRTDGGGYWEPYRSRKEALGAERVWVICRRQMPSLS